MPRACTYPHLEACSASAQAALEAKGRIFEDNDGDFTFDRRTWKALLGRPSGRLSAIEHRDEAYRRKIVCRLESREKETAHWLAQQRFLENLFKLEPLK